MAHRDMKFQKNEIDDTIPKCHRPAPDVGLETYQTKMPSRWHKCPLFFHFFASSILFWFGDLEKCQVDV